MVLAGSWRGTVNPLSLGPLFGLEIQPELVVQIHFRTRARLNERK